MKAKYPYVVVRNPDTGILERHHEDRFFDDLTRDPERRTPWRSEQNQTTKGSK